MRRIIYWPGSSGQVIKTEPLLSIRRKRNSWRKKGPTKHFNLPGYHEPSALKTGVVEFSCGAMPMFLVTSHPATGIEVNCTRYLCIFQDKRLKWERSKIITSEDTTRICEKILFTARLSW